MFMIPIGKEYFEGPDPIDLSNVKILHDHFFFVAPKIDGMRFIMYHDSEKPYGKKTFLVNRKGDKFEYQSEELVREECLYFSRENKMKKTGKKTIIPKKAMPFTNAKKFVIDIEKISDDLFYILDVLEFDNFDLRKKPFYIRHEILNGIFFSEDKKNEQNCFFPLKYIAWKPTIKIEEIIENYQFIIDGIIFYSSDGNYKDIKYRYKFKDTIDFEAGKNGSLKLLIGNGDFQRTEYFRQWKNVFATTKDCVKEGFIYECGYDLKKQNWHVIKQRHDKSKPNKLQVGRYIFFNIIMKKRYIRPFL